MKKIKNTIILLIFVILCGNIYSQTNTHAFVQDWQLNGTVTSTAYTLSELDLSVNETGSPSFISAFTNNDGYNTSLNFRRTDPRLENHINRYNIATCIMPEALTVTDIKEVKEPGRNFEIVFCGNHTMSNGQTTAYIGLLDRNFNPIGSINEHWRVKNFHSIVEVPGFGFIACGEGHYNNGFIIAVDYNLNLISSYEDIRFIFTDVEYNTTDDCVYIAGYSRLIESQNELCVYGIDHRQMYNGFPNPCFNGFIYQDHNFNIEWNKSGKDDIKIISLGNSIVALAASGESRMTGRNLGVFHVNTIDGYNPTHNIYYDTYGQNIYFKEFVNFGDTYNLLLQEDGSNNPIIVEMDPFQNTGNWDAIRITNNVNSDMQMFKRGGCQMLDILTFDNAMIYSDCHSQVVGINYQPIEQPTGQLSFNHMPTYPTQTIPMLFQYGAYYPNFMPMQHGWNNSIITTTWYQGDFYNRCMDFTDTYKNTHAFVQDWQLNGTVTSTAYALSELDFYGVSNGVPSYISAFTYEDNSNNSYLHFRRTDPCLGEYDNHYSVVTATGVASNGIPRDAFRVTDVKEVKNSSGNFEIVFCGSYKNTVSYMAMLDRHLNPITNIIEYNNVRSFNSIIEVPGFGFIACGEGLNNNGIVIAVDYNLNIMSNYEYPGYIFTDLEYDMTANYVYMAGYSPNELCVIGIDYMQMYGGFTNPHFNGFTYYDHNFNIEWNKSGKDDVKIISLGNNTIALAASGESRITGRNLGIFHVNTIDGHNPTHNIYYSIHEMNTYFKEFVNFGNKYNLLLQEGNSNDPFIVEMNPIRDQNSWNAIRIMNNVNPDMQMFKRNDIQNLEILTFNDNMINYSDCHSQVVGIDYQPIELQDNINVNSMLANTYNYQFTFNLLNITNILVMNPGMNSRIGPTILYQGDCHDYYTRSTMAENYSIFENEATETNSVNNSVNNSVMIYDNTIELQDAANYSDYMIFDIMGRLIVKSKVDKNSISTSGMPNGTYIIHLSKTNGEVEHHKFVRQ